MLEARRASQIDFAPDGTPIVVGNSNAGGLPLFSIIQVPLNSERLGFLSLAKDNGLLSGDVFVDAYNELVKLSLTGNEPSIVTMAEYEAEILAKGKCGKFGLSITNKQFKIPFIPGAFLQSKESSADVGIWTPDQIRPIVGNVSFPEGSGTGPFKNGARRGDAVTQQSAWNWMTSGIFDSSLLGINYSGSKTKPESVSVDYQMKLYGTLTNKAQVDMADIVNQLTGKLDVGIYNSDLDTRIKAYAFVSGGTSPTLIRSKGFASLVRVTYGTTQLTFTSPMLDLDYLVIGTPIAVDSTRPLYISNKTLTSFTVGIHMPGTNPSSNDGNNPYSVIVI